MESITALNNGLIKFPGVLLFTCHDRERTYLAGRPGVHILTLNGGAVCSH